MIFEKKKDAGCLSILGLVLFMMVLWFFVIGFCWNSLIAPAFNQQSFTNDQIVALVLAATIYDFANAAVKAISKELI